MADLPGLTPDGRWDIPARINMAAQCLAHPQQQVAIIDRSTGPVTYGDLTKMTHGLAHHLIAQGVKPGDRVGVLRAQDPWTLAAHMAVWAMGAISIPLFKLFGPDALLTRINDAGAKLVVTDAEGHPGLTEWGGATVVPEAATLAEAPFPLADTGPEDPAIIIYTSGTTGAPKGALHGHRLLTGHLPGVALSHDHLGQPGDCLWTPADWAWIGGLFDVALPALALGIPVVAARFEKFTAEEAARLVEETGVRNVFFPPTALRLIKAAGVSIPGLRSVASGGEPLGAEMLDWGRSAFGLTINEFYGQTECNMVASSYAGTHRPGCIGKPVPGFNITILGPEGEEGDIAIHKDTAPMMLGYWNRPEATAEKFQGDWMLTGDRGTWDEGFLRFVGREDDVITSAGYRIGPAEIEDCLLQHEAVATCGVVGKPDPMRTEIVKAYVVLKPGAEASAKALQAFVKERLTLYAYPREIAFVEALPMTVTGKIIRKELKRMAAEETL